MLASKSNHASCVKFLLHHGALLTLRDKDGLTALTLAIRAGSKETAELLAETVQGQLIGRNYYHAGQGFGIGNGAMGGEGTAIFPPPSAQVFGLAASPQQMAQEEFDKSTNFLVAVTEQLRRYITHGKQAVYENGKQEGQGGRMDGMKPLAASASSPLHLGTPLASIPRSSSSYFNSLPSIAASPRNAPPERMSEATSATTHAAGAFRPTPTTAAAGVPPILTSSANPVASHDAHATDGIPYSALASTRMPQMSPTSGTGDSWSFLPISATTAQSTANAR
jgi:ankyrin repeat protein